VALQFCNGSRVNWVCRRCTPQMCGRYSICHHVGGAVTGTSSGTGTVERSLMSSADTAAPAGSVPEACLQQTTRI